MKNPFIIFLTFLTINCKAQIAVEAVKMNILYTRVANPIKVAAAGCSCENLFVQASVGSLSKDYECGSYYYKSDSSGSVTFTVYCRKNKVLIKKGAQHFKIQFWKIPVLPVIGGKHSGSVSADYLRAQPGVVMSTNDAELSSRPVITHFRFTLVLKEGKSFTVICDGPKFNTAIRNLFQIISVGDRIIIDEIWYHWADGYPGFSQDPFSLEIN